MEFQRGITERQRVRLILADLLKANALYERAKEDHAAFGQPATAGKMEEARVALVKLQAEARRVVETAGYYRDRERLAELLKVKWAWLMTLAWPICTRAADVGL